MSEILDKAVAALTTKLGAEGFGGTVKFDIEGEGSVIVDGQQSPPVVSAGDGDAAVTIAATKETFEQMMKGELDATAAYMSGLIKIDGDIGAAMKMARRLA